MENMHTQIYIVCTSKTRQRNPRISCKMILFFIFFKDSLDIIQHLFSKLSIFLGFFKDHGVANLIPNGVGQKHHISKHQWAPCISCSEAGMFEYFHFWKILSMGYWSFLAFFDSQMQIILAQFIKVLNIGLCLAEISSF